MPALPSPSQPLANPQPATATQDAPSQPLANPQPATATQDAPSQPLANPQPATATQDAPSQPLANPQPATATQDAPSQPLANPQPATATQDAPSQPLANPQPATATQDAPSQPLANPQPATALPTTPQEIWRGLQRPYQLGFGFSFRREDFGGVIHHFEGKKPDPRLIFLRSDLFLLLLERVEQRTGALLSDILEEASCEHGLSLEHRTAVMRFFERLIASKALVPCQADPNDAACSPNACQKRPTPKSKPPQQKVPIHVPVRELLRSQPLTSPLTVTWEVTNRCNLRCLHCLSNSSPDADTSGELSTAESFQVIEQLAAEGVFQIHFGGGEPFSRPDFMQLLKHARHHGFCCLCISTNGYSLTPRRIAELEALGGVYLQLSLDGASEQTCDAVRGKGVYQAVVRALKRLQHSRLISTLNFVYCRHNAHELDAMYALAQQYDATLRVTRLKPSGRGTQTYQRLRPTQQQLQQLHVWLKTHHKVLTGDTFFHLNPLGETPLKGAPYCGAGRMTALIVPNGKVYPCAFTQTDFFAAGDLRKADFGSIWRESPAFNTLFRGKPQGPCTSCSAYQSCGGGCPAVKHALTGQLNIADPDCVIETARQIQGQVALCEPA